MTSFKSLRESLDFLESKGQLRRVEEEVDPDLGMAEIQRRVYAAKGPALLFTRVRGTKFPCVSNLFGTRERTLLLLGDGVRHAQELLKLKSDPIRAFKNPVQSLRSVVGAHHALPRASLQPAVVENQIPLHELPQIKSWPKDGGAFITWPLVYTEDPAKPGLFASNLGMYRVQTSGGEYVPDREAGLHYQIHRGIGVHHYAAIQRGEKLKVTVFVGGPPAHMLAAVMPLPEGIPEILFAGILGGRAFRYVRPNGSKGHLLSADADFCITGTIDPSRTLPEGPFGDHLGYYSLRHPFPVLTIEKVYHRRDAVWPFTVVGRPPQEDSHLAELIHEIGGDALTQEIPGLHSVHAVEAAGVHPLLLALAKDRYVPYSQERKPRELHTIGHALLGYGQLSLAKYLWLAAHEDDTTLNIRDVPAFFRHVLRRVSWEKDLHFVTRTTMDTLDYSGSGLNEGSKVLLTVSGGVRRELAQTVPHELLNLWPEHWSAPKMVMPGVLAFSSSPAIGKDAMPESVDAELEKFSARLKEAGNSDSLLAGLPLWILADDPGFVSQSMDNFLWVAFTRSDPARDVHGIFAFTDRKHWGCRGPLVIDARLKPHHAPPLESDPAVARRVEAMAAPGKSLHGLI